MEIENLKKQILDDYGKIVLGSTIKFRDAHLSFFQQYQEDIQNLRKLETPDQSAMQFPTDIWESINKHLEYLREKVIELGEHHQKILDQPSLENWKEMTIPLIKQTPRKHFTAFSLEKLRSEEHDSFWQKRKKKYSFLYYNLIDKVLYLINRKKRFINNGRKFYPDKFLQMFLLLPAAQIMNERWNNELKIIAQIFDQLAMTTEHLKDKILVKEKMPEKDIYWRKVTNPERSAIIPDYEESVNLIADLCESFYTSISIEINDGIADLSRNLEHNQAIAGTFLLANRKYTQRKINRQWRLIFKKQKHLRDSWESIIMKFRDELFKNIDLAQVQLKAAGYWYKTAQIIKNKFYNDIVTHFKEIKKRIGVAKDSIQMESGKFEDKSELKNKMLLLNRKLVKAIRNENLPELLSLLDPDLFSQSFSGFIKRLNSDIENLPEEHIILTHVDMETLPIRIKSDKVALKDILQGEALQAAELRINDINDSLRPDLDASSRSLSRIDQVIEYNLEGALNKIREEEGEASWQEGIEIIFQGLERVEQNIDELLNSLQLKIDESLKNFDIITADLEEEIQVLGDNEELLKLKIRLTKARTKKKILEYRKQIWQSFRLFLPKLVQILNNAFKKLLERYSKVRRLARLDVADIHSELSFTQYLSDVEYKISQMPYIYQRIFRTEALEENKFFVGRTEVLNTINQDFEDFKKNYHPLTALVGEKGSGKTSTLNYCRRNILKGLPIAEIDISTTISTSEVLLDNIKPAFNLPEVQSIDELIHILNEQSESRICIIENIHNLFLRTIDGFQALEDFLLLISKTRQKIFWIVSCGRYAWEYFETVTKISSFFKRIIHLKDLSTDELKEMILSRHQISGYGINYLPTDRIIHSRQYKKLTNPLLQQQFLEDYFFKRLSESAEGNIRTAIYFWLSAIDEFEESDINISLDIKSESQFLYQLPTDDILSLAAFIQHEYLDEEKHAIIFNQVFTDSSIHIEKLYKKGLLLRKEDYFMVHPYLYRPVVKALKLRNII